MQLRHICEVVSIVLNYSDDVIVSALTECILVRRQFYVFGNFCFRVYGSHTLETHGLSFLIFLFHLLEDTLIDVELTEILVIFRKVWTTRSSFLNLLNFDSLKLTKCALGMVQIVTHEFNCFKKRQLLMALLAQYCNIFDGVLATSVLDQLNDLPLLLKPISKLISHIRNQIIVEVNLLICPLDIQRLQKESLL